MSATTCEGLKYAYKRAQSLVGFGSKLEIFESLKPPSSRASIVTRN